MYPPWGSRFQKDRGVNIRAMVGDSQIVVSHCQSRHPSTITYLPNLQHHHQWVIFFSLLILDKTCKNTTRIFSLVLLPFPISTWAQICVLYKCTLCHVNWCWSREIEKDICLSATSALVDHPSQLVFIWIFIQHTKKTPVFQIAYMPNRHRLFCLLSNFKIKNSSETVIRWP